jgi:integrase
MLLPLKAIILKQPRKKDRLHPIYYQYCYSSEKRVLLDSGIAIPGSYWNKKRQFIKDLPADYQPADTLNTELLRIKKIVESLIERGTKEQALNMGKYVKEQFSPSADLAAIGREPVLIPIKRKEPDLFKEMDSYLVSKERKICPKGLSNIRSLKIHLEAFQQHRKQLVNFSSLDYNFYCDFVDFLTYDYLLPRKKEAVYGLKVNSIGKDIKQLRVFINDRVRRKIIPTIDMSGFKILDEDVDVVYLTYGEIAKLYTFDLSHDPLLFLHRDLFVLGSLTGLRFSDFSVLRQSDMRGGMLFKKMEKTDGRVVIPLRKEAAEIFARSIPKNGVKVSGPVFNRSIKEIATLTGLTELVTFSYKKGTKTVTETKPKGAWVTSHTCRRSFATNEFLAGTPLNLVQQITGHKSIKDFLKYIKISELEAAQKVQEIWQSRNGMGVFDIATATKITAAVV